MWLVNLIRFSLVAAKSIQKWSQLMTKCLTRHFCITLLQEYSAGACCLRELKPVPVYWLDLVWHLTTGLPCLVLMSFKNSKFILELGTLESKAECFMYVFYAKELEKNANYSIWLISTYNPLSESWVPWVSVAVQEPGKDEEGIQQNMLTPALRMCWGRRGPAKPQPGCPGPSHTLQHRRETSQTNSHRQNFK